jgi:hypothetical protein
MKRLYLKSELSLEELAAHISTISLPTFERQLRDGLNLGGGEYFKFSRDENTILLVCNDDEHLEVFVEEMKTFPYYCYARTGTGDEILQEMRSSLTAQGFECDLDDDA